MRVLTREESSSLDNLVAHKYGLSGLVLMENAGLKVATYINEILPELAGKQIIIFAGPGNNGGDGFVIARHLFNHDAHVRLFLTCSAEKLRGDALINWQIAEKMGIKTQFLPNLQNMEILKVAFFNCDLIVDAMLGTGLNNNVTGLIGDIIGVINQSGKPVVAVDIPSGLSADTGKPLGCAVKADFTMTFAYPKLGMILPPAREFIGELTVADISIPAAAVEHLSSKRFLLDDVFCRRWLKARNIETHKGTYGHVLLIAGSDNMPGAALLCSKAVLRMGAGLLTLASTQSVCRLLPNQLPEGMLLELDVKAGGTIVQSNLDKIKNAVGNTIVLGPGLGRKKETIKLIHDLFASANKNMVVDADGLYALSTFREKIKDYPNHLILTPHPGEMANLMDVDISVIENNRLAMAEKAAKQFNAVIVLKGAGTIIAAPDGTTFINPTGNPGLATGGSGDVLAGMIGALLAQDFPPAVAAALGVYLHGKTADMLVKKGAELSLIAGDIAETLPQCLNQLLNV